MVPFKILKALAAPIKQDNIDTDQILPARFLMMPRDQRYGTYLFRDLRQDNNGLKTPDFFMNQKKFAEAQIIVAGRNFGCGSSREGAVFTLVDSGFRSVIAPSFGDIFYNNSFNNGLLPIVLPETLVKKLQQFLINEAAPEITIDLETQQVFCEATSWAKFDIDPHRRERLLKGLDMIDYTQQFREAINRYESDYLVDKKWL